MCVENFQLFNFFVFGEYEKFSTTKFSQLQYLCMLRNHRSSVCEVCVLMSVCVYGCVYVYVCCVCLCLDVYCIMNAHAAYFVR